MKHSSWIIGRFDALRTRVLSIRVIPFWAPAFIPDAPAPFDVIPPVSGKVAKPPCLSWEASFKEMAAEHEDWSDLDSAMCDGLEELEEELMTT